MTGYGEGLYRRPSDGKLVRVNIRTEDDIRQYGWEPVCPETGEVLEPVPTPEDAALLARNVYALTKRYQEELALSLGQVYGFPVVCLRLFNVYGPRQSLSNPYTGVLAIFLSRLLAGQPPVVYEDGHQTRDFVSVHDVVHAVMLALNSEAANGQVINIGTGIPRPIGECARTLAHLLGRDDIEPRITEQFRKGDIRHCFADIGKARTLLGFEPQIVWEDGLAELIEWSRNVPAVIDRFSQAEHELRKYGLVR
jgi:dTDP-L-rhamnose 4-epimerase